MADELVTKRITTYNAINYPTEDFANDDVLFVDGSLKGTRKVNVKAILNALNGDIDKAIKSSNVSVTTSNYSSIITNVDDQPINSIYAYAAGLQSNIANLPSNAALTILHYTYKIATATGIGQVMIAAERSGTNATMYFRTTGGSPVTWSSWQKLANNADVENEINNLKADLYEELDYHFGGGYISGTGDISAQTANKELVSELIPVLPGMTFELAQKQTETPSTSKWLAICEYDSNYVQVGTRYTATEEAATNPWKINYTVQGSNTRFLRISYRSFANIVTLSVKRPSTYDVYGQAQNYKDAILNNYNINDVFEIGSWRYSNGIWSEEDLSYRVKSKDWIAINTPTAFQIPVEYRMDIGYINSSGTLSTARNVVSFFATSAGKIRITIKRAAESTSEVLTSVDEFVSSLLYSDPVYLLQNNVDELNTDMVFTKNILCRTDFIHGINHRGWYLYPENTLEAYKASRLNGFLEVETDVQFTSNDVPVLLHDGTINRTGRNADGSAIDQTIAIGNITYSEALAYDFGVYKGEEFAGIKLPTFEDFIKLCRCIGLVPYVEIKNSTKAQTEANIQGLVDIVKKYGMDKDVVWIGFQKNILGHVKNYDPYATIGLLCGDITSDIISDAQSLKTNTNTVFIDTSYLTITDAKIDSCISAGLPVMLYTIDGLSDMLSINGYVTGVTSNKLDASREIYRASFL